MSLEEDEEMRELRIARRQWLDPDRKEEIMGALKKMVMDYDYMDSKMILGALSDASNSKLLGFGEASYADLENVLGPPTIKQDRRFNGYGIRGFNDKVQRLVWSWTVRVAWGIKWSDDAVIVIHDRDSSVKDMEDLKHWHVTGDRRGWERLNSGLIMDDYCVKLIGA
jgi:hypothetical protein